MPVFWGGQYLWKYVNSSDRFRMPGRRGNSLLALSCVHTELQTLPTSCGAPVEAEGSVLREFWRELTWVEPSELSGCFSSKGF